MELPNFTLQRLQKMVLSLKILNNLHMYKNPLNQIKLRTIRNNIKTLWRRGWFINQMVMMKLIMYWDILDSGCPERFDNI